MVGRGLELLGVLSPQVPPSLEGWLCGPST